MKYVYNRITLDVDDMTSQVSLSIKKGDTARGIIATLVKDGKMFEIEDGCSVVFTAISSEGSIIDAGCQVQNNKISLVFPNDFVYWSGKADCDISVSDTAGKTIASPHFSVVFFNPAREQYARDAVESSAFQQLTSLVEQATNVIAQAVQTEDNISAAEAERVTAESERKTAESERKSEEVARNQRVAQITSDLENGNIVAKKAITAENWTGSEQMFLPPEEDDGRLTAAGYYYFFARHSLYDNIIGLIYWGGVGKQTHARFDSNDHKELRLTIDTDGYYKIYRRQYYSSSGGYEYSEDIDYSRTIYCKKVW